MAGKLHHPVRCSSGLSRIWQTPPPDMVERLRRTLDVACRERGACGPTRIVFRADDVGVPGPQLARLMDLFMTHRIPLALSVVPAWLTRQRWLTLRRYEQKNSGLWCWHQHGWRHVNHESEGKKQEFGPSRSALDVKTDLVKGKDRLEAIMGTAFSPIFCPPWNRCSRTTLELVKELHYHAVSRFRGSLPPAPNGLPDIQLNVDLHTRKTGGWKQLFTELKTALSSGFCGIMIHHRWMNETAFSFMESLMEQIKKQKRIIPILLDRLPCKTGSPFLPGADFPD